MIHMKNNPGHYASIAQAEKYVQITKAVLHDLFGKHFDKILIVYHFGSMKRPELESFLKSMSKSGFARCVSRDIDFVENAGIGERKFQWVPSKRVLLTGKLLLSEYRKYRMLAESAGVVFGGIECAPRQNED